MALTLRTDEELDNALTTLSEIEGTSRQEVIRRAVLDRLAQVVHDTAVEEATTRLMAKWGDVLDRLGRE